jgi:UPF0042 nucleotide-binding protein
MKQDADDARRRVVLVSGLSGGGKASALHILEDLGYEAVDNMPLPMIEAVVDGAQRNLAVGVDIRTSGFDTATVLAMLARLRADPQRRAELMYLSADEATLLRRYTETRRRHPMAPQGRVADGIAGEITKTDALREAADLAIDTSGLPLAALRQLIEGHFGAASAPDAPALVVTLISFAYPQGLPKDADLVFDARFLRNPHYDPLLRPHTGLDKDVGDYVASDPDYEQFFNNLTQMLGLLLPRFVQEGKKYATIAIGCTGGRHRSVYLVEQLSCELVGQIASRRLPWRLHVSHRELAREGLSAAYLSNRSVVQPEQEFRDAAGQPREAGPSDALDMPAKTAHEGP